MSDPAIDVNLYAAVELMGRRTRAGIISDATLGGATLLRIEHPTRSDHSGGDPLVEYYSPQAIFAIRPCSRDEAIRVSAWAWPSTQPETRALAPVFADLMDHDEAEQYYDPDEQD